MNFEVRTDSLSGTATALGWARGHTVVIDRPADGGGQDLGFECTGPTPHRRLLVPEIRNLR